MAAKPTQQGGGPQEQRRRHFRVSYPVSARAVLVYGPQRFDICDISEEGVKFFYDAIRERAGLPQQMSGTVELLCGGSAPISGVVVRMEAGMAVLQLDSPIPYKLIHREELLLIRKFRCKIHREIASLRHK